MNLKSNSLPNYLTREHINVNRKGQEIYFLQFDEQRVFGGKGSECMRVSHWINSAYCIGLLMQRVVLVYIMDFQFLLKNIAFEGELVKLPFSKTLKIMLAKLLKSKKWDLFCLLNLQMWHHNICQIKMQDLVRKANFQWDRISIFQSSIYDYVP